MMTQQPPQMVSQQPPQMFAQQPPQMDPQSQLVYAQQPVHGDHDYTR
jgi:hypothetical protein